MCDEPNPCVEKLTKINDDQWRSIRKIFLTKELRLKDVQDTSIGQYLSEHWDLDDEDSEEDLPQLIGLLELPDVLTEDFYAVEVDGDVHFFTTEIEAQRLLIRDHCDYVWDDLEDKILARWIGRLFDSPIEFWRK